MGVPWGLSSGAPCLWVGREYSFNFGDCELTSLDDVHMERKRPIRKRRPSLVWVAVEHFLTR
jgi:hypothetical protein